MEERLQKLISRAGIASRRHAEQLILSGAVTVNGRVITELGTKADVERDHIAVGPRVVRAPQAGLQAYFAFFKPAQVVSTMSDPEGRRCLGPFVRNTKGRLFPVGRIEFDAAGLMLLTSDGELASDLMRAAAAVAQTWRFKVKGRIPPDQRPALEREGGARLEAHRDGDNAWYEAEVRDASRDRMRKTLYRRGFFVEKMVRSGFAGIELGGLRPGEMRELNAEELRALRAAARGRIGPPVAKASAPAPARAFVRRESASRKGRAHLPPGRIDRTSRPWSGKARAVPGAARGGRPPFKKRATGSAPKSRNQRRSGPHRKRGQ